MQPNIIRRLLLTCIAASLRATFVVAAIVAFATCKKKDQNVTPDLPPATQTGANTFGCRVNGVAVSIEGRGFNGPYTSVSHTMGGQTYMIALFATEIENPRSEFSFYIPDQGDGTYTLADTYPIHAEYSYYGSGSTIPTGTNTYRTDSLHTLTVNVYTVLGHSVSGTFSGSMANDSGQVVQITDGRFDIADN